MVVSFKVEVVGVNFGEVGIGAILDVWLVIVDEISGVVVELSLVRFGDE